MSIHRKEIELLALELMGRFTIYSNDNDSSSEILPVTKLELADNIEKYLKDSGLIITREQ